MRISVEMGTLLGIRTYDIGFVYMAQVAWQTRPCKKRDDTTYGAPLPTVPQYRNNFQIEKLGNTQRGEAHRYDWSQHNENAPTASAKQYGV